MENGVVRTPDGFKKAYQEFTAAGWTGIAADVDYGGQGLPATMDTLVTEMLCSLAAKMVCSRRFSMVLP